MESGCGIAVGVGIGVAVEIAVGTIVGDGVTVLVGVGRGVGTTCVVHAPINNKNMMRKIIFLMKFLNFMKSITNKFAFTLPRKTDKYYRFLPVRKYEEDNSSCNCF